MLRFDKQGASVFEEVHVAMTDFALMTQTVVPFISEREIIECVMFADFILQ